MGYAFISYSSKNQSEADAMRTLLTKNSIDTWMAPYDIPAGSEYAEVIYDALMGCSCLVLMLTDVSQNSQWVKKEVNIAISNGKVIIPVKLEDIELNSSMNLYLNDQHIIPVRVIDEKSEEIQSILHSVSSLVSKKTETSHRVGKDRKKVLVTESATAENPIANEIQEVKLPLWIKWPFICVLYFVLPIVPIVLTVARLKFNKKHPQFINDGFKKTMIIFAVYLIFLFLFSFLMA